MSQQPRPTTLNFITGNKNKLAEVQAILASVDGLTLQSRNVEGAEIQGTIEEVARDKCSRAAEEVSPPSPTHSPPPSTMASVNHYVGFRWWSKRTIGSGTRMRARARSGTLTESGGAGSVVHVHKGVGRVCLGTYIP